MKNGAKAAKMVKNERYLPMNEPQLLELYAVLCTTSIPMEVKILWAIRVLENHQIHHSRLPWPDSLITDVELRARAVEPA